VCVSEQRKPKYKGFKTVFKETLGIVGQRIRQLQSLCLHNVTLKVEEINSYFADRNPLSQCLNSLYHKAGGFGDLHSKRVCYSAI
jgi:hypothetical protein